MYTGQNALCKISSTAEPTFGAVISNPSWSLLGIITSVETDRNTTINKIFGIGSKAAQAQYAGAVENTLRVETIAPTANILRTAIPISDSLSSYNFVVGEHNQALKGVGLKWNQLTISIPEDEPLTASFDGIFKSLLTAPVSVPKSVPTNPILWKRTGLTLTIDGTQDNDVLGLEITVNNNVTRKGTDNSISNQKRTAKQLEDGNLDVEAKITTYTRPNINLEANGFGCPGVSFNIVASFVNECSQLSNPETLVITLQNGIYTNIKESINPNEIVQYEISIQFGNITIT